VPLPPWIFSSEYMYPLLVAYDQKISELESQNKVFTEKIEYLDTNLKTVIKENEELHEKLKNNINHAMKKIESDVEGGFTMPKHEWKELQERMELLDKENKILQQEQQELQRELNGRIRDDKVSNDPCKYIFQHFALKAYFVN